MNCVKVGKNVIVDEARRVEFGIHQIILLQGRADGCAEKQLIVQQVAVIFRSGGKARARYQTAHMHANTAHARTKSLREFFVFDYVEIVLNSLRFVGF